MIFGEKKCHQIFENRNGGAQIYLSRIFRRKNKTNNTAAFTQHSHALRAHVLLNAHLALLLSFQAVAVQANSVVSLQTISVLLSLKRFS